MIKFVFCSIELDLRRSELIGRLSVRCFRERFNWDSVIIGTFSFFVSVFSEREIFVIFSVRLSESVGTRISCR